MRDAYRSQTLSSDVSDDEFGACCGLSHAVAPWRWMANDLPTWPIVYQQAQRWMRAGCFEALAEDSHILARLADGRNAQPSAAVIDSRTLRSTPESGAKAGYGDAKRKKGSKLPLAGDTLGRFLALHVTQADADDRAEGGRMAKAVQATTDQSGEKSAQAAGENGKQLEVVELPEAQRGFVFLPRRWVAEHSFGWTTRFRNSSMTTNDALRPSQTSML